MFVGRFVASNHRNAADRNTMIANVPKARQNISVSFFFKKVELVVVACIENFKQGKSWMVLQDQNANLVPREDQHCPVRVSWRAEQLLLLDF